MPNDRPFPLLAAAHRVGTTIDDLSVALAEIHGLHDRLYKLERQTSGLLGPVLDDPGSRANSLLVSNRHKFRALQAAISQASKACEQARKSVDRSVATLDELLTTHSRRDAAATVDDFITSTREAAFRRGLNKLIDEMLDKVSDLNQPGDFTMPEESHGYIPFGLDGFLELLIRVNDLLETDPEYSIGPNRYRPVSFLEVGCGPGKLLLAARLTRLVNFQSFAGFDLNKNMVMQGKSGLGLEDELFVADALEVDYGPYDLIFSYRPIRDPDMQLALEQRMVDTMAPGAYLLAPLDEDLARHTDMHRIRGTRAIWKKRPQVEIGNSDDQNP